MMSERAAPTPVTRDESAERRPIALVCEALRLRYGRTVALDGLDLRVEPSSALGIVGRNGAGKSTLFRAILGLEPLVGGVVRVEPEVASRAEMLARIGYVPDHLSAHDWMTVGGTIDFVGQLRGNVDGAWCSRLIDRLQLERRLRVRALSRGMQARLAFLLGVMHRPALLLLDEPFLGADAVSHDTILATLATLRDETGCAVVVASHGLGDLARITERIAFIDGGRIVEEIGTDALIASTKRIILRPAPDPFVAPPETVHVARRDETTVVTVRNFSRELLERLRTSIPDGRIDVVDVTIAEACADRMRGMEATR